MLQSGRSASDLNSDIVRRSERHADQPRPVHRRTTECYFQRRVLRNFYPRDAMLAQCYRERKCADTTGTVLVPWVGHFQS